MDKQPLRGFLLCGISWLIVAFGQPAWSSSLSIGASLGGYALFWLLLLDIPQKKTRFYLGTAWFMAVQLLQLSWGLSHPFYYIIAPYLLYALLIGLQFGFVCLFIEKKLFSSWKGMLGVSSLWVFMEWSRLFFFSGFAFNPVGLALAGSTITLQMASLAGIYGLSFWVILTNLLTVRLRLEGFKISWLAVFAVPFLFGSLQLAFEKSTPEAEFRAILVQTAFPVEEGLCFTSHNELVRHVTDEWKKILTFTKPHIEQNAHLLALPEFVVPFGAYSFVYSYEEARQAFVEIFGSEKALLLPELKLPLAVQDGGKWKVNNAFWAQSLANVFNTSVAAGMEDAEDVEGQRRYYSAGLLFHPHSKAYNVKRYAKRILVPMGEYIPFRFCRELAANYGVMGSFTPGEKAEVWDCQNFSLGVSICYEEMFSEMTRENRVKGAQILLNLTSDAWFPHSKLIRQHFEHARLRTVENGIPLIRACNTGITGCIDSHGRDVALFGDNDREREDLSGALFVQVPLQSYDTLYSRAGDHLILGIALLCALLWAFTFRFKN